MVKSRGSAPSGDGLRGFGDLSDDKRVATCVGCGDVIADQFILRVSPDLEWHQACLKCCECQAFLDERSTCFVREGKPFCKRDYTRLFGAKCAKCQGPFGRSDYVMRARSKIFHLDCFHCQSCRRPLVPGEEFALRGENLFCKFHYEGMEASLNRSLDSADSFRAGSPLLPPVSSPLARSPSEPICSSTPIPLALAPDSVASSVGSGPHSSGASSSCSKGPSGGHSDKKRKEQKTTRVRTVLNEKQLHTLRTCYNANPRPDALMKEQLVEMTSLSPRVIRVWFQNKRCKDKKRQILVKQMQQHQEKTSTLNAIRLQGVGPLVADAPGRHEISSMQPVDIAQFQQSSALWKLNDFSQSDSAESHSTPFQQLLSGFGDPSLDPTGPLSFLSRSERDVSSPQLLHSDLSSPSCSPE